MADPNITIEHYHELQMELRQPDDINDWFGDGPSRAEGGGSPSLQDCDPSLQDFDPSLQEFDPSLQDCDPSLHSGSPSRLN